jgi:serine phosphatase RsbU (regulator of sigma subunit)
MTQSLPFPARESSREGPPRSLGAWLLLNLVVLVAYSVLGVVILFFGIGPAKISPIYPPAGIAVAAVVVLGPRILPAVFVGQFLNGFPLLFEPDTTVAMYVLGNLGTGVGGALEAWVAAWLLQRLTGTWHPFDRSRDVVVFLLASSLLAALPNAILGSLSLWLAGFVSPGEFGLTFVTFVLSDAAGIAVFGALVLAWVREPQLDRTVVATCLIAIAGAALIAGLAMTSRFPVDFLYLPLLLWTAFRGGPRGVTVAATAITAFAILTTIDGVGSFVGKTPAESILLLEVFMAVITFTGLLTVAILAQRRAAEAALEAHNRMLEQRVRERTAEVAEKNRLLEEKQARIDEDLQTARVLQASILPVDFSAYRATAIAASMRPALEVSGDFYDVFPLPDGRLGLVVADVSGKGMAAAFFMAVTRTLLRGIAAECGSAADCLARVNETLCRENPIDMFVTALYAELDEATGVVQLVNAGHCEPIVVRADGRTETVRRAGNPPLGVTAGRIFAERSVTLGPGEMLFLYTDGVTEAVNLEGEQFRMARLVEIAQASAGQSPQELMLTVIGRVEKFSAGTLQADDITCLAVRRNAGKWGVRKLRE